MNWQIGIGIVLQGLSSLAFLADAHTGLIRAFASLQAVSAVVAGAGAVLIVVGERTVGARTVIAGSFLFVPLGLLAIFGARRILDQEAEAHFNRGE